MIAKMRIWGKINHNVLYACIKLSNNIINFILKSVPIHPEKAINKRKWEQKVERSCKNGKVYEQGKENGHPTFL